MRDNDRIENQINDVEVTNQENTDIEPENDADIIRAAMEDMEDTEDEIEEEDYDDYYDDYDPID